MIEHDIWNCSPFYLKVTGKLSEIKWYKIFKPENSQKYFSASNQTDIFVLKG